MAPAVVRRLALPPGARVVAVGGATLGGSGKTTLAVACAAELARAGARVALVGHAYRASPAAARVVEGADAIEDVGDEALLAARALGPLGARVVVAPSRAAAVRLAARAAEVLVLDGVAQTAPARASLALLAVDAVEPWGRVRALPPRGDLRAPVAALLGACNLVVRVGDANELGDCRREEPYAEVRSRGAWVGADLLTWDALRAARVGFVSALARPGRVTRAIERRGVRVRVAIRAADHGPVPMRALREAHDKGGVDLWLATPKCALHLEAGVVPFARLDHCVSLAPSLAARVRAV
jgi:tetraacyldisaccharide 4'-kinase